jgi:SAM-dependent methyltransferase
VPAADESPRAFYDALADHYDAIFADWWAGARWHAEIVAGVLQRVGAQPPARILDCACGIGTQALPLVQRGYAVTGSDISSEEIARARREAAARGIDIELRVADMRALTGTYDAVIACDNAIPHLLDDADLDAALTSIAAVLEPNGVFLASIRDYDALRIEQPSGVPGVLRERDGRREIVGQAWEWADDLERIRINLFVLTEQPAGEWSTVVHTTWYRALTRATLDAALARARFHDITWYPPADSGYYQPIVTARAAR